MLKEDYRRVKKAADETLCKRKRNKGKGFEDISDRDVRQFKTTIVNNLSLTNGKLFTMAGITNIKRDKRIIKQIN